MLAFRVTGNFWAIFISALGASLVRHMLWQLVHFLNLLHEPLLALKVWLISFLNMCKDASCHFYCYHMANGTYHCV